LTNLLQKRYEGFLKTPYLWLGKSTNNLEQFEISSQPKKIDITVDENLRLGKYVERLVSFELLQHKNITILAENIQIQDNQLTLGELDCLLIKNNQPIHLEIIYKFYLYDNSVGNTEIEHFIGPNRKDALVEKLNKLQEKQQPLLYSKFCKPYLEQLNLTTKDIVQQVYFKAQLFLPFNNQNIKLEHLNNDCIVGFYVNQNQIKNFKDCKFFIPIKKDWLIVPHANVNWFNYDHFNDATQNHSIEKYSYLFWLKHPNGVIKKMFLVWW
jgi:hypothetical protein